MFQLWSSVSLLSFFNIILNLVFFPWSQGFGIRRWVGEEDSDGISKREYWNCGGSEEREESDSDGIIIEIEDRNKRRKKRKKE